MRRVFFVAVAAVLVVVLFLQVSQPAPLAMAAMQSTQVVRFTVYVGYLGFNDTSGNLTLNVNQGDTVVITFIWNDSSLPFENAHQIGIEGYNQKTGLLNAQTNTSVVQFTTGSVGTFRIHCIVPCLGMNAMQNGWLLVKSVGSSNTVSTTLSILSAYASNGSLFVSAHLAESNRTAVVGALVDFSMQTGFGVMSAGSNTSSSNGDIQITTQMPVPSNTEIFASFPGGGSLNSSSAVAIVNSSAPCSSPDTKASDPPDPPGASSPCGSAPVSPASLLNSSPPYVSGQKDGMDLRLVGVPPVASEVVVGTFILVLVSAYIVIGLVLVKVLGIRRNKSALGK